MPRFAANLSMLCREHAFLAHVAAAADELAARLPGRTAASSSGAIW